MTEGAYKTKVCEVNVYSILELGPEFFEQIKIHYFKIFNLEMTQDQLYNVAFQKLMPKKSVNGSLEW